MGACWSNRIKAESPLHTGLTSKTGSKDGNDWSKSNSKLSVSSTPQTPRSEGEILQSSNLKNFSFNELKTSTRNFRPDSVLGEGGFGAVFKGWIDERSLTPTRPGTGMVIAVKRLNQEGPQGHREWLVGIIAPLHYVWIGGNENGRKRRRGKWFSHLDTNRGKDVNGGRGRFG